VNIANEFILGLDTLRAYNAPVAMEGQMLRRYGAPGRDP
jgi:hypothetical protein